MQDYIYKYLQTHEHSAITDENSDNNNNNGVKKLHTELNFQIPAEIQAQIEQTKVTVNKMIDDLEISILQFDAFGKNFPKSQKLSPDAFVQVAIQLAFYRDQNLWANSYESGSLRKFNLGRTEIIRACTADACEFVRAMTDAKSKNQADCARLLLKAISSHREYTANVMKFEAFDRHLLGLKLMAQEMNVELPDLFKDVALKKLSHFYVSSSQVSSKVDTAVTFYGPLVIDGYGCCYSITEKKLMFGLSSSNSCSTTSAKRFGIQLQNSLIDCQNLLLKVNHKL
jgi:carnitine O-acetyltransferase